MNILKEYRDNVAGAIKQTSKNEREDFLEKEKAAPEYEIASLLKKYENLKIQKEKANTKFKEAKRALDMEISPTSVKVEENFRGYGYSGYDSRDMEDIIKRRFFLNHDIDKERFNAMFHAMLDEEVKQKFIGLYANIDVAKAEFDNVNQLFNEQNKVINHKIEELGGGKVMREKLAIRSDLLDSYIKNTEDKQAIIDKLKTQKSSEDSTV